MTDGAWYKDFGEIITSGTIKNLPQLFITDETSNAYKLTFALDCELDRISNSQKHRDKGRTVEVPFNDNAIGEFLDELGRYWGIERMSDEPTDSFINRLTYHWGYYEGGGSSGSLKQTIYYFIGPEAFADELENTNAIIISDPSSSGSEVYYWNDVTNSRWGSGTTIYSYWAEDMKNVYSFNIDIYLEYNDYVGKPQRKHFDYWGQMSGSYATQAERNRIILKKIIDIAKPLGKTYTLTIHGSAPPS